MPGQPQEDSPGTENLQPRCNPVKESCCGVRGSRGRPRGGLPLPGCRSRTHTRWSAPSASHRVPLCCPAASDSRAEAPPLSWPFLRHAECLFSLLSCQTQLLQIFSSLAEFHHLTMPTVSLQMSRRGAIACMLLQKRTRTTLRDWGIKA